MSHREHNKAVIQELKMINQIIDRKIIRGDDYRRESKRHFQLLRMLGRSRSRWSLQGIFTSLSLF